MDINKMEITPNGSDLTIRTGTAPKIIDPFDYQGFRYTALTPESFIELVKAKGVKENTIVFMNDVGFSAILDDSVTDRNQDEVRYEFETSTQVKEWRGILSEGGLGFQVKSFCDFLKLREEGEIDGISELLFAAQNFKYATNITGDYTFDSRNNYTFSIKVNEADGTVRIPAVMIAKIEIYRGSGLVQDVEIEIDIHKPKSAEEQPVFHLLCPKWQRYVEKAKEHEFERLTTTLAGWLVVTGFYRD